MIGLKLVLQLTSTMIEFENILLDRIQEDTFTIQHSTLN